MNSKTSGSNVSSLLLCYILKYFVWPNVGESTIVGLPCLFNELWTEACLPLCKVNNFFFFSLTEPLEPGGSPITSILTKELLTIHRHHFLYRTHPLSCITEFRIMPWRHPHLPLRVKLGSIDHNWIEKLFKKPCERFPNKERLICHQNYSAPSEPKQSQPLGTGSRRPLCS